MAAEFFIHKMSEHMETARILRWLVKEGDPVRQYQVIMEVETDKAVVDMEAPAAGVIRGIRPGAVEGAEVKVGETICWIAAPEEEIPAGGMSERQGSESRPAPSTVPPPAAVQSQGETPPGEVRATPLARKVARELGVDLGLVAGSGPKGIIRDEDVRAFSASPAASPAVSTPRAGAETAASELVELSAVQAISARRMTQSWQTAPQFSLSLEADMTDALWLQNALAERIQAETGHKLSLTALIVKVTAEALKSHPLANASFEDGKLRLFKQINLGVAVGTQNGLVVPVIRGADGCALHEVVRRMAEFQNKAETLHFAPADLEGGTFTLSNLGMYGILQFDAILNPPQSAILTVGKVVRRPAELADGGIGLRPLMNLTLTADHRVMDGLQAARFLVEVKERLEKPYFLIS